MERAYFNGILGNQHPEKPGVMLYYTPLGMGFNKGTVGDQNPFGWGNQFESFWCCYASGIEQWAKIADNVYFHTPDDKQLYINLYVASTLTWTRPNGTVILSQQTNFPLEPEMKFTITKQATSAEFEVMLHIPYWVNGGSLTVNGNSWNATFTPSTFISVKRVWMEGDTFSLTLPMSLHLSPINDAPNYSAVMHGPLVLVGLTTRPHTINLNSQSLENCFQAVSGQPSTFQTTTSCSDEQLTFMPLFQVVDENYGVYWEIKN